MKISTVVCLAVCCMLLLPAPMMMRDRSQATVSPPTTAPPRDLMLPSVGEETAIGEVLRPCFLENKGQMQGSDVALYAEGDGMSVGFRRGGVVMVLEAAPRTDLAVAREEAEAGDSKVIDVLFDGCRDVAPVGVDEIGYESNFLVGNDRSRWVSGAQSFREVVYDDLWDGVDLRYYFKDGVLKYDVVVRPGGRVGDVVMRYSGIEGLRIDPATGDLLIGLEGGSSLKDLAPMASQVIGEREEAVGCSYVLVGDDSVGYRLGLYDPTATVVIDPGLIYSTYLGGKSGEILTCVDRAEDGYVYACGPVSGAGFPVTNGSYDAIYRFGKCVIIKLEPDLTRVVWATYFGGSRIMGFAELPTIPRALTIKPNGDLLITGDTVVMDLPVTPDALKASKSYSWDSFILVMDPDGREVRYCSYFGGSGWDSYMSHRLMDDGDVYLVGWSDGGDLPTTPGAYLRESLGGDDVYIARLNPTLTTVLNCTLFGGSGWEAVGIPHPIDIDAEGNVCIVGLTFSDDLVTTPTAFSTTRTSTDADVFVLKMDPTLSDVLYCTYIGGSGQDWPFVVSARLDGTIMVAGWVQSDDFPVTEGCLDDELSGAQDIFVTVVDTGTKDLRYSTYLGGNGDDEMHAGELDVLSDTLHITGTTTSTDLMCTAGCYNPSYSGGASDLFVMSFDLGSFSLAYCTYLGGSGKNTEDIMEWGLGMHIDADGRLLCVGASSATDFPTTSGAIDRTYNGGADDGILYMMNPRPVPTPPPPDVFFLEPGDGHVNISWTPVINEGYVTTGYVVYWGEDPSTTNAVNVRGLRWTHNNLENGRRYYYRVATRNSAGVGPHSEVQFTVPMGVPSAPIGLALATGDGTVRVSWSPPATTKGGQLLGYHIWAGEAPDAMQPVKTVSVVATWTDDAVTVGSRYFYKVVAFNERGNGTPSDVKDVLVTSPPGPPQSLTASAGPGQVGLAWEPPTYAGGAVLIGYRVLRGPTALSMAVIGTTLPGELSYTDREVVNGTQYLYGVRAFTVVNESEPAGPVSATPYGPPWGPTDLRATPGDGQALLEWSPPANEGGRPVTGYRVYAGPSPGDLSVAATVSTGTSHYLAGLVNGKAVVVAVAAINEMGEGQASEAIGLTPYGLPSKPLNLTLSAGPDGVMLRWGAPEQMGGAHDLSYLVERGPSPTALTAIMTVEAATGYLDATVQMGTTYHYRVLAVNPLGNAGEPTETLVVAVPSYPGPVVGLAARPGDGIVHLAWGPPADDGGAPVLGYIIMKASGEKDLVQYRVAAGNSSFTDDDVINGQAYRYTISAENLMGEGLPSSSVSATPLERPLAPWDLTAEVDGSRVSLRWKSPLGEGAPVTGYLVYRGTDPEALSLVAEVGERLEYSDDGVGRGETYYYRVVANSTVGESEPSQTLDVPIGNGLGSPILVLVVLVVAVIAIVVALMRRTHGKTEPPKEE